MREERFPWGLGAILVLVIVGGIGFWLGSSNATPVIVPVAAPVAAPVAPAPVAPAPVTPIYPAYAPQGGGFPLFPLFFGLIVLVVIVKVARHAAWSGQRSSSWSGSGPGAASCGPSGFGGHDSRSSRRRHHRGHDWYGQGFDAEDSMDQNAGDTASGQQGSDTAGSASDAGARQGRPGFWNGRDVPPMVDEMFQRWHSRMHAAEASATPSAEDEGGSLNIPQPTQPTQTDPSV